MDVQLPPGTYVVAVSGGVDSVVLLDVLQHQRSTVKPRALRLIVAHFDHGIRPDSLEDLVLVRQLSERYGLPFVYDRVSLGPFASEGSARKLRYSFLETVMKASQARAIVTAHHQDDLLETAIINMVRGTSRKGLTALYGGPGIERPLLDIPKAAIREYAVENGLIWHEDSTNSDERYLRNYIRLRIMPKFNEDARAQLVAIINRLHALNREIDQLLDKQLHIQSVGGMIDRQWFNKLPHSVAKETMAAWLRSRGERNFDSEKLVQLVIAAKVARPGSYYSVSKKHQLGVTLRFLALDTLER